MDIIAKRNTETFQQALKDVTAKMFEQQKQIDNLHNSLSTVYERMNQLEQKLIIQKVQLTGLGPSVKQNGSNN